MEKNLESKMQLIQLKIFLSKVSNYSIALDAGISADQMLEDLLQEEGIHHVSKYGKCYYTNEKRQQCGASENVLPEEENDRVLTELDALAYAYSKMTFYNGNMPAPKNKLIYARIKSMKRRD